MPAETRRIPTPAQDHGKSDGERYDTNESVQSGGERPCITGSITWRRRNHDGVADQRAEDAASLQLRDPTAPTSGLRPNVAKPTTSTPPPDDVEGSRTDRVT